MSRRWARTLLLAMSIGVAAWIAVKPNPPRRLPPIDVVVPTRTPPPDDAVGEGWWRTERKTRMQRIASWRAEHVEEEQWFRRHTVGRIGLPFIAFRALPVLMPELWGRYEAELGMRPDPEAVLPIELSFGDGPKPVADLPGLNRVRMQVVTVSCGSCHIGEVVGPGGASIELLGAPNTRVDLLAFRRRVAVTVRDARFTAHGIQTILDQHPIGWAYGSGNEVQERIDRILFKAKGDEILALLREKIGANEARLEATLARTAYRNDEELLHGGLPGMTDGYSVIAARLMPQELVDEADPWVLAAWMPPQPAVVDFRSVWYQGARARAQWDGSVRTPLMRNLGAAFGIIGVPSQLDYDNAVLAGRFTEGLPPPPYPFDLDAEQVRKGAAIYYEACASCHDHEVWLSADAVGTDPGRANVLQPRVREVAVQALRRACVDDGEPQCRVGDDSILSPSDEGRGYLAPPLAGIWASAPYFHNGSVPTLTHVLVPSARPTVFWRGNTAYDCDNGGFAWEHATAGATRYKTERSGCNNDGHADKDVFFGGIDFGAEPARRVALVAYLLTL